MNYDTFGRAYTNEEELVNMLYQNPELDLGKFLVTDPSAYNHAVTHMFVNFPKLKKFESLEFDNIADFDQAMQHTWHMPDKYKNMDIAKWVLEQCQQPHELQRVGEELLLYQERDLFPLLCYMKYMVDTFRANNIVWGLGRGSSVASYVLYLIGVHKIDSIYYDLPITEFLK
jgi:DNA polymerase III alpha subunit